MEPKPQPEVTWARLISASWRELMGKYLRDKRLAAILAVSERLSTATSCHVIGTAPGNLNGPTRSNNATLSG